MNRDVQDTVLALLGATVLAVALTDVHLRYVKPSMQPLLVVAGVLLLAVGLFDASREREPAAGDEAAPADALHAEAHAEAHDGAHEGEHAAPRTSWLLVLPVLVLVLVTPGALGSFSADRAPSRPPAEVSGFPELGPDRDGAVDLSLTSFTSRVAYAPETLEGRRVRVSGFVSPRRRAAGRSHGSGCPAARPTAARSGCAPPASWPSGCRRATPGSRWSARPARSRTATTAASPRGSASRSSARSRSRPTRTSRARQAPGGGKGRRRPPRPTPGGRAARRGPPRPR